MNTIDKKDCFVGPKSKPFVLVLEKLYRFLSLFKKKNRSASPPRRILLCNWASLGDLVIATSIIAPLRKTWPTAEIGFLVANWTKEVVERHPDIHWIHTVESWKNLRLGHPLWKRFLVYLKSARRARKEIRKIQYDLAIELYPFFFNATALLWRCGIPERTGFDSAGFSSLLTRPSSWKGEGYLADRYRFLLKELNIPAEETLCPSLGKVPPEPSPRLKKILPAEKKYLILHMGTGGPAKEWKEEYWRELASHLVMRGYSLLFTGKGTREKKRIENVTCGLSSCYDLCDAIDWEDLLFLIHQCTALISLDSVTVHVAGAFRRPCIILFLGTFDPCLWNPSHPGCMALIQQKGEEITPAKVLEAFEML